MFSNAQIEAMRKAAEKKKKAKAERRRLKPLAEQYRRDGEKFKVLGRPYERRRKLDTSYYYKIKQSFEVVIRAVDEDNNPLDVTRIWGTFNGSNKDFRRPAKGKGEYGDYGPYVIEYTPKSTGISKLKVQVEGDRPGIIFYQIRDI